jgi:hypothetical protein
VTNPAGREEEPQGTAGVFTHPPTEAGKLAHCARKRQYRNPLLSLPAPGVGSGKSCAASACAAFVSDRRDPGKTTVRVLPFLHHGFAGKRVDVVQPLSDKRPRLAALSDTIRVYDLSIAI